MKNVKITNVEWDFDGETEKTVEEAYSYLPSVPFYISIYDEGYDDDYLPVADAISDEYGWCVKNCEYEIIK